MSDEEQGNQIDLTRPMDTDPLSSLDHEQRARVTALGATAPLLTTKSIGSRTAPEVADLISLAAWVMDGVPVPMLEGVTEVDEATIIWQGVTYYAAVEEDEEDLGNLNQEEEE